MQMHANSPGACGHWSPFQARRLALRLSESEALCTRYRDGLKEAIEKGQNYKTSTQELTAKLTLAEVGPWFLHFLGYFLFPTVSACQTCFQVDWIFAVFCGCCFFVSYRLSLLGMLSG